MNPKWPEVNFCVPGKRGTRLEKQSHFEQTGHRMDKWQPCSWDNGISARSMTLQLQGSLPLLGQVWLGLHLLKPSCMFPASTTEI